MDLKNKKVLVTGSEGFIGSHLVEALIEEGCQVKAFVLYNSFNHWGWLESLPKEKLDQIEIFQGDVRDPFGVKDAMKGCEVVFHLAALIAIPYSYHSPQSYVDTNVQGTLNVVQAARELGIQKVIHTSTSETYGTAQFVPITELHPLQGQSPYSATKIGADQIAISYHFSFDLPLAIIRPFNTFGPRQSNRAIIPTILSQLLAGEKKIKLGNLSPTRDLNYVTNTVDGFIQVAKSEASIGETINIGYGDEISIGDLAQMIIQITGKPAEVITEEQRLRPDKSEVFRLFASIEKAEKLVGYKPRVTFEEGLTKTIEWFSQPENLKQYKTHLYVI